jgi:hypothetical protein
VAVGVGVRVVAVSGAVEGGSDAGLMLLLQPTEGLMVSLMRVTSPVSANSRPSTVTPEPTVIEVAAMTVPTKVGPSSVAELPICQNTLHGEAPLIYATLLVVEVTRLCDAPVWKMNTPAPDSVRVCGPLIVIPMVSDPSEGDWYTPEVRVSPARSSPVGFVEVVARIIGGPSLLAA